MRRCLRSALLLALATPAMAPADVGRPGFQFLNLGTSARLEALGGTGGALAEGADALDWNPARLLDAPDRSATASGFQWMEDVVGAHAAFAQPTSFGAVAVGVRSLAVDSFDNTDLEDPVDQSDVAVSVGAASPVRGNLSAGVGAKYLRSSLAGEDAAGFALDAGLNYRWVRGWDAVMAVRNAGPGIAYGDGREDQLPTQVRAGVGGTLAKLQFGLEGVWENGPDWGGTAGAEYRFFQRVAVRAGSRLGGPEALTNPWAVGAGVTVHPGLRVDYSFRDGDIAASHRIGLAWDGAGAHAAGDQARSARKFYADVVDRALDEGLKDAPGAAGDSVIVRPAAEHPAGEIVAERVAERLRARGLRVEVRKPVPDLPDSLKQAKAEMLKEQGLTREVDLPLMEVAIRTSTYEHVRAWRDRWIGPQTVERVARVELGLAWRLPGDQEPTWMSAGSASDQEQVASDRIPESPGYPRAGGTAATKPNRFVEPAIVSGIVAALAALFFSNRNVGN